jgi:hypothetical protein
LPTSAPYWRRIRKSVTGSTLLPGGTGANTPGGLRGTLKNATDGSALERRVCGRQRIRRTLHGMDAKTIRELLPSRGPAWEAAIDMGIDVTLLDANLQMTVEERLLALVELNEVADELQAAGRRAQTP